jgi:hypothetical protein
VSLLSELIARLRTLIVHTDEAKTGLHLAREQLEQAAAAARAVTDGSSNPLPAGGDTRLQAAIAKADEASALIASGNHALEQYITGPLLGGSGGGGAPPGAPPPPAAPPPEARPFKPMRTDPEKADELRPYVGEPIAYATLYDEHGRKLVGIHNAGDDGPARDADWREPWASMPRLRRHVEAHAAARMTQDRHRQLAMYINMPPCSYPDGCKLNVADLLPKGTTLWVHQAQANGMVRVHRFGGTGKAIRDDQ